MNCASSCLRYAAAALALLAGACASHQPPPRPAAPTRVVGYYFGPTLNRGFRVRDIKARYLSHINYAFANILADGTAVLGNPAVDTTNFRELARLKRSNRHLQVLIAFGGWGGSKYFSEAAATQESRQRFITSALSVFFDGYPGVFDGIDLDWEYPTGGGLRSNITRPEDRENLTALVSELRRALDERGARDGRRYVITAATPAGRDHFKRYELAKLTALLDFFNVMTYDYHTAGRVAHFNAPFASGPDDPTPHLNVSQTTADYLAAGVTADKLVIGVPFYGYGYGGVGPENEGRFQPAERNGFEESGEQPRWVGTIRYYQVEEAMKEGFVRHFDEAARVPWLYNPTMRVWITYDDAQSIAEKANFVRNSRLGGIVIWELSGDRGRLLPVITRQLTRTQSN